MRTGFANAGADGNEDGDADFTGEDARGLTGGVGEMYEVTVDDAKCYDTYVLCCDRM